MMVFVVVGGGAIMDAGVHHTKIPLQWHHNCCKSVSNHQPHDCLLSRLFRRSSKKRSKLRVTGLCAGNSAGTSEFPAQMASNADNISIWWRHHGLKYQLMLIDTRPQSMTWAFQIYLRTRVTTWLASDMILSTKTRLDATFVVWLFVWLMFNNSSCHLHLLN